MSPAVSVVIPARDAAAHLPRCLAGVARQRITDGELEVIVVDNGSRDETPVIAERAGARVVREARPGPAAARNAGVAASGGALVAFLDSDCHPRDGWLEQLTAPLRDAPQLGAVGGRIVPAPTRTLVQRYAARQGYLRQEDALAHPYLPWVLTANCCYRRSAFCRLGGFDASLAQAGEDVDLAWRMQQQLGLGIAFAAEAVVEHVHRETVRGLWHQWTKYGWGRVGLSARYPAAQDSAAQHPAAQHPAAQHPAAQHPARSTRLSVSEIVGWNSLRLARSARAAGGLVLGRSEWLDVVTPLLEIIEQVAHRVGRLRALRARPAAVTHVTAAEGPPRPAGIL